MIHGGRIDSMSAKHWSLWEHCLHRGGILEFSHTFSPAKVLLIPMMTSIKRCQTRSLRTFFLPAHQIPLAPMFLQALAMVITTSPSTNSRAHLGIKSVFSSSRLMPSWREKSQMRSSPPEWCNAIRFSVSTFPVVWLDWGLAPMQMIS